MSVETHYPTTELSKARKELKDNLKVTEERDVEIELLRAELQSSGKGHFYHLGVQKLLLNNEQLQIEVGNVLERVEGGG